MFGSSKSWGLNSTHLHGTHVPVQEPSTASKADMCSAIRHVCFGPIADISTDQEGLGAASISTSVCVASHAAALFPTRIHDPLARERRRLVGQLPAPSRSNILYFGWPVSA